MANDVWMMVEKYLRDNGYDGLCNEDGCACEVDNLYICCEPSFNCEAGYKHPCDCCGDHDFHIEIDKPVEKGE